MSLQQSSSYFKRVTNRKDIPPPDDKYLEAIFNKKMLKFL
jgi:hypothetical protein